MAKFGKKYRAILKDAPKQPVSIEEAIKFIKAHPAAKFDETLDVAFCLGTNCVRSDSPVRGTVKLPAGSGKNVKVLVFAGGEHADQAKAAGADYVGYEDLVEKIKNDWQEFDILIATPNAMKLVRPLGRQLGPRGLMPNPKTGTVTEDVASAVKEAKAGRVEFRADKGGCVHVPFGKLSFTAEALEANLRVIIDALVKARPSSTKGAYMLGCTVSATMTPGVKLAAKELSGE